MGNGTACEGECATGGGAAVAQVVGMGCVDAAAELERRRWAGKRRQGLVRGQRFVLWCRQCWIGFGFLVDDAPIDCAAKAFGNTFEHVAVFSGRGDGEL